MNHNTCVKIPYDVFLALLRVHVGDVGTEEDLRLIQQFLVDKTKSMAARQQYTHSLFDKKTPV